uniref:Putative ATP-binding protein PYRAB09480 n=1 Tax=Anthurium amnicola TaxID=1678845 RepID=A0A1D1XNA8_9ARAE
METQGLASLLRQAAADERKTRMGSGGMFKMFKLVPMLSTGCKMVALLGRPSRGLLQASSATTTVTLFGQRRGRVSLAMQDDPGGPPVFLVELPMLTSLLHKEMASGVVKIALESESRTPRRKLTEEFVWAVYCNGRKSGYSIRRRHCSDDERYVLQVLRGVSTGAGVLPSDSRDAPVDYNGEMTYMRARFERVVGSKDSEALYMINPDATGVPELSIFLVRVK